MANAPLTLRFGSDVSGLEGAKKGVASLAASIATNMASVAGSALAAGKSVQGIATSTLSTFQNIQRGAALVPTAIFAIGAAFATLKVAEAAIGGVKAELALLLEIADKSKQSGISAEFFQSFVAGAKGAEERVKAFEAALTQAFQATKDVLNPDWSVWDQGVTKVTAIETALRGMRELFSTDQKFTGLDLFRNAQNQDQKIMAVLTAMKELNAIGRQAAALDIGEKMFGAEFADRIRRGQESVDRLLDTIAKKITSPDIISGDTVTRAKELDDRLNDAWRTISERIKPDWDDLGNIALRIKGVWTSIIEAVAAYKIEANKANPPTPIATDESARNSSDPSVPAFANPVLLNQGRRRRGQAPDISPAAPVDESRGLDMTRRSMPVDVVEAIPLPMRRPLDAPKPPPVTSKDGLDQIETFVNRMQRANDVLKVELETEGKSNVEKAKGIALAQADAAARAAQRDLTDQERSKVLELAAAHAVLENKLKDVQQAQRNAAEATRYFGGLTSDVLGDLIVDGKSASEVFNSLSKTLLKAGIQALITGQGPLASILGTAPLASSGSNAVGGLAGGLGQLLGFRANGGDVIAGRPYKTGETGEELFVPGQNGRVYPIGKGGTGLGGNSVRMSLSIDLRGANGDETISRIANQAAQRGAQQALAAANAGAPARQQRYNLLGT